MTVVYPRLKQATAGGFDDLDGLLWVHRIPKFKFWPERNGGLCSGG